MIRVFADWRHRRQFGATFVEATLALIIIFFSLLAIVDFSRYMMVSILLNYSAQSGADLVSKIDLNASIDGSGCDQNPGDCAEFDAGVDAVIEKAFQLPSLIGSTSEAAGITLEQFQMYRPDDYLTPAISGEIRERTSTVGFMRPGEHIRRVSDGTYLEHPTRPSKLAGGPGWPDPGLGESWDPLLSAQPTVVTFEATIRPYLPFLGPLKVRAIQFGYRRSPQFGAAALPIDLNPLPEGTLTPPPDPESTPEAVPSPTPTPDGGEVPTPVPAITPTLSFTPSADCSALPCNEACDCEFFHCVEIGCISSCPVCGD